MFRKFFLAHIILLILLKSVSAENVDKINLTGNERITKESIIVFGKIDLNDDFNEEKLNNIIKNLYDTNFFEDIKINLKDGTLSIIVVENPIVQSIKMIGVKANKLKDQLFDAMKLKKNSSYNEFLLKEDRDVILNILKSSGFYFANVKLEKIDNWKNTKCSETGMKAIIETDTFETFFETNPAKK